MTSEEKIHVLKRLEQECYSVCLYLLEDSNAAVAVAKLTLSELYLNKQFWDACDSKHLAIMRRKASYYCLQQVILCPV
jgi:hypothetical protein